MKQLQLHSLLNVHFAISNFRAKKQLLKAEGSEGLTYLVCERKNNHSVCYIIGLVNIHYAHFGELYHVFSLTLQFY